jgi:hypothetical protein
VLPVDNCRVVREVVNGGFPGIHMGYQDVMLLIFPSYFMFVKCFALDFAFDSGAKLDLSESASIDDGCERKIIMSSRCCVGRPEKEKEEQIKIQSYY